MEGLVLFALALAGFGWVVVRPEWGAPYFAFLIFLRFSDVLRGEFGLPSLFMLLGPALLVLAAVRWLFNGEGGGRGWKTATWLLLTYGAVCAGSLLFASETERTRDALMNYADGMVIVLIITLYLRNVRDLQRTVWALLIAGGVLAFLAVLQQLTGSYDASYAGFSKAELRNIFDAQSGFRSEGPVSANYFALILVVLVPLATDRLLHATRAKVRWLAAAILLLVIAAIVSTYSRGGIVALVAVSLPMLVWVPRRRLGRTVLLVSVPVLLVGFFLLPSDYLQRLSALGQIAGAARGELPADSALRGRLSEVSSAALMFRDHPILGVGYGNFEIHYPRYAQTLGLDARREERQAHSLYLEVAAETGLIGLGAFGLLLVAAFAGPWRARSQIAGGDDDGNEDAARFVAAFGIALFGYLAGSIFLHLTYPRYFWLLLGIAFAVAPLARAAGTAQAARLPEARLAERSA
jgi:O-antigen ligase